MTAPVGVVGVRERQQQIDDSASVADIAAELIRQPEIEQVGRHLVLQPVRPRLINAVADRVRLHPREQRFSLLS